MGRMTSKERIIKTIKGEEVDMLPVSPRMGYALLKKYGNASLNSHMKFQKVYDYDIMFITGSGLPNPIDNGASIDIPYTENVEAKKKEWFEGDLKVVERVFNTPAGTLRDITKIAPSGREYGMSPNPVIIEHLIKDRSDLEKLEYLMPQPSKHCDLKKYYKEKAQLKDNGIVQVCIRCPLDHLAGMARGMEQLMIDYYDDRKFFDDIISFFMKRTMGETKVCLEEGVDHIFGSWYFTSISAGWSPKMFRDLFLPLMKEHIELVHSYGATYDLYDDGKCMDVMEYYGESGTDILETLTPPPVGDVDLAKTKKMIGEKVCLKGFIDLIYVVQLGTPELVRNTIKEAIDIAAPGGRFILGNSDSFREGTPWENIETYFKYAREYGKYIR